MWFSILLINSIEFAYFHIWIELRSDYNNFRNKRKKWTQMSWVFEILLKLYDAIELNIDNFRQYSFIDLLWLFFRILIHVCFLNYERLLLGRKIGMSQERTFLTKIIEINRFLSQRSSYISKTRQTCPENFDARV